MIDPKFIGFAKLAANHYNLDPDLILAIIIQESAGNPLAIRAEVAFYEKYTKPLNFTDTEEICRAMSWGLMQVMGQVARELGFKERYLTALLSPEININFGCQHLAAKIKRFGTIEKGIAAYNAGSPRTKKDGKFVNQDYVDAVLHNLAQVKSDQGVP